MNGQFLHMECNIVGRLYAYIVIGMPFLRTIDFKIVGKDFL